MAKKKDPNVMVVYGSDSDLISLRVVELMNDHRLKGWDILELDAKKEVVDEHSFGGGLFDSDEKFYVVWGASKAKGVDKVLESALEGSFRVVYVHEGELTKNLEQIKVREGYAELKGEKLVARAVAYLKSQVEKSGRSISEPLCKAVVSRAGVDLGVLKYEALKLALVAEGKDLTKEEVASVVSSLSEVEGSALVSALLTYNTQHFLRVSARYESFKKGNHLAFFSYFLFPRISELLEVRLAIDKGAGVEAIAERFGVPSWRAKSMVESAKGAPSSDFFQGLIDVLYVCERASFSDGVSPFARFKAGVLRLLES